MVLFFIIASLETLVLGIYFISVGSQEGGAIVANLSLSRMIVSLVIILIAAIFIFLAVMALRGRNKNEGFPNSLLKNQKKLFFLFCSSILLIVCMLFLIVQPSTFGGNYKQIITHLEPIFAWLLLLSEQTAAFILIWFCGYFVMNKSTSITDTKKELSVLFSIFFIALIAKWLFVSTDAFGPGVGDEMKYFDMADSLRRGFFSIAQTHVAPPLYPIAFIPALAFGKYTFEIIKLVNAIISTSIIFPIYFISRTFLNSKQSLIPVIISCFNPFHLVFPRRILSENIYFPMFLWTMYFVLKKPFAKTAGLIWDILTGVLLGMLYLTRYISLVIIPMFLIAWWIKPFGEADNFLRPSLKKIFRLLIIGITILLIFSPWVILAIKEHVPVKSALGFVITANTNPQQLTIGNLLKWLLLYISYIVIMASPYIPILIRSITFIDFSNWRNDYGRFIFQVLIVMVGFLAAASRHSWRAIYNSESPTIIMGRYVSFLSVPFLILFCVTFFLYKSSKKNLKIDTGILFFSAILVIFAYFVIVQPIIINVEPYFARIETSADAFYVSILGNLFFVLICFLYCFYLLISVRTKNQKLIVKAIFITLFLFYSVGWIKYANLLRANQTNSWLSAEIAKLSSTSIYDDDSSDEGLSLYLPESFGNKERIEIYNGLRVRGLDNTKFYKFQNNHVTNMPTEYGITINECDDDSINGVNEGTKVEFNNACYILNYF
ncbi:MAG: hypothetical protein PWQ55_2478 [Chloroflexota bacterium]|nr:hypothetical protein [Chloroflexota bacterium]